MAKEQELIEQINQAFTVRQQKLIEAHQKDISTIYQPKITGLH